MNRNFKHKSRGIALGLAACLTIATTAVVAAVVTSDPGPFTGCLETKATAKGTLYNVAIGSAPSAACAKGATQITFSNAQGPLGPQGPTGQQGPHGDTGATGATGPAADLSALARGTNVTIVANRLVLGNGDAFVPLLRLPGLGELSGDCPGDASTAHIRWSNTTTLAVDMWSNFGLDDPFLAQIAAPGSDRYVSDWTPDVPNGPKAHARGDTLILGYGDAANPRRTATVTLAAFRTGAGAPCGIQAVATVWSAP